MVFGASSRVVGGCWGSGVSYLGSFNGASVPLKGVWGSLWVRFRALVCSYMNLEQGEFPQTITRRDLKIISNFCYLKSY